MRADTVDFHGEKDLLPANDREVAKLKETPASEDATALDQVARDGLAYLDPARGLQPDLLRRLALCNAILVEVCGCLPRVNFLLKELAE